MAPNETKNLSWKDAWWYLLNGKHIKRPLWKGYWVWENDTIMMHCRDGSVTDIRDTDFVAYTFSNIAQRSVRTPKKEKQSYWVCTDAGYQCQARWTDNIGFGSHGWWQWHFLDIPQYQKVVAWMKLPMSYHGGNNDDT